MLLPSVEKGCILHFVFSRKQFLVGVFPCFGILHLVLSQEGAVGQCPPPLPPVQVFLPQKRELHTYAAGEALALWFSSCLLSRSLYHIISEKIFSPDQMLSFTLPSTA